MRLNTYYRNTFKRENLNIKNNEIAFYSFKQYLSIDIYTDIYRCTSEVMEIHLSILSMFLKDKAFK